jgi:Leishmanolysin
MKRALPLLSFALVLAACGPSTPQSSVPTSSIATPDIATPDTAVNQPLVTDPGMTQDLASLATEPYNITLNFAPGSAPAVVTAMRTAARRWEGVVTQGLPSLRGNIAAGSCGDNPAFNGTIDDVLVFTGSINIDGPGGVLAQSGPCSIRSSGGLTTYSTLVFDSADVAGFGPQLATIATHELGHTLGIGTLWSRKGLVRGIGGSNPTYTGSNGLREWRSLGGTGNVPVENTGGAGTAGGHWRETTFDNELMTGFLKNAPVTPLSRLTIGSLQDMGYAVNYGAADAYSLPGALNTQTVADPIDLNIQMIEPKFEVK